LYSQLRYCKTEVEQPKNFFIAVEDNQILSMGLQTSGVLPVGKMHYSTVWDVWKRGEDDLKLDEIVGALSKVPGS